jgi:hypothetical protein
MEKSPFLEADFLKYSKLSSINFCLCTEWVSYFWNNNKYTQTISNSEILGNRNCRKLSFDIAQKTSLAMLKLCFSENRLPAYYFGLILLFYSGP